MQRQVMFVVAYDGTDFHGWQEQPGQRTVQGVLQDAARHVLRHPLAVRGAGRTDAGVHAAGQIATFPVETTLSASRLRYAIGGRLPKDMSVVRAREVSSELVPSRHAISKLYRYRIHAATGRPVETLQHRYTYHCWTPLDIGRMRSAARHFVGRRDFAAMASKGSKRITTVREVLRCEVVRRFEEIRIEVEGTGFLYNQVRNMVGTLIEVGRGHWEVDRVVEIMASRDRREGGPTAPAKGLSLQWVRLPPHLLVSESAEADGELPETASRPFD